MSRVIDLAINEHIFFNKFDTNDILNFSDNKIECLTLMHFVEGCTETSFRIHQIGEYYHVFTLSMEFSVKHKSLTVAICLASLATAGLDKKEIKELEYEYNFEKGIL